jgi:hypothetical protein
MVLWTDSRGKVKLGGGRGWSGSMLVMDGRGMEEVKEEDGRAGGGRNGLL